MTTIVTEVNKLDSKQSGAPRLVDVVGSVNTVRLDMLTFVGSVNTIRLRRYGWNTPKEGSLRRKTNKKKKNKVEEIQLTNLASLGSLASKNGTF